MAKTRIKYTFFTSRDEIKKIIIHVYNFKHDRLFALNDVIHVAHYDDVAKSAMSAKIETELKKWSLNLSKSDILITKFSL